MDIKLRARLSAYSKLESASGVALPDPTSGSDGSVVGVEQNQFMLFETIDRSQIDSLFTDIGQSTIVTKPEIDTIFENTDC